MILLAYVDDLVLAAGTTPEIDWMLDALASNWKISRLGPIGHILGTKISGDRTKKTARIPQTAHIDSLIIHFPGATT